MDDIFAVQDEITREIVVALSVRLTQGEEARIWSGRTSNFEVWEYISRAVMAQNRVTREGNREAQRLSRKALEIEPDSPMALMLLGWALAVAARYGFETDGEAAREEADSLASRLLTIDPENSDGHALKGYIHVNRLLYDKAITSGECAIALAPSVATNHAALALTLYYSGRFQQCLTRIRKAMRLSPYFPEWFLVPLGEGYRGIGELEKARAVFEYYTARMPDSLASQARLACVLAELGNEAQARTVAETVLSLDPGFSAVRFVESAPLKDSIEREKFLAGMVKAGLPE
jgi:adenylate cyclase